MEPLHPNSIPHQQNKSTSSRKDQKGSATAAAQPEQHKLTAGVPSRDPRGCSFGLVGPRGTRLTLAEGAPRVGGRRERDPASLPYFARSLRYGSSSTALVEWLYSGSTVAVQQQNRSPGKVITDQCGAATPCNRAET